jgi:AcrR family transcriptional regulator
VREIGSNLRRRMRSATVDAAGQLDAERLGLRAFLEFTHEHPGLLRIVQESQFVDEAAFREYYERLAKSYSDILRDSGRDGEAVAGDADTRAWAVMGIGHFLGMRWCLWQGRLPDEQVIDETIQLVARSLAGDALNIGVGIGMPR